MSRKVPKRYKHLAVVLVLLLTINKTISAPASDDQLTEENLLYCLNSGWRFHFIDGQLTGATIPPASNSRLTRNALQLSTLTFLQLSSTDLAATETSELSSLNTLVLEDAETRPAVGKKNFAESILSLPALTTLCIRRSQTTERIASSIAECRKVLPRSNISSMSLPFWRAGDLSQILSTVQLSTLTIRLLDGHQMTQSDWQAISAQQNLERLTIVGPSGFIEDLELSSLASLRQLKSLSLMHMKFNPKLLAVFNSLEKLSVNRCQATSSILEVFEHQTLRTLVIRDCTLRELDVEARDATGPGPPREVSIELQFPELTDIPSFDFPNVRVSVTTGNNCESDLSPFDTDWQTETLRMYERPCLGMNTIDELDLAAAERLSKMRALRSITVSGDGIVTTHAVIERLLEMPSPEHIDLSGMSAPDSSSQIAIIDTQENLKSLGLPSAAVTVMIRPSNLQKLSMYIGSGSHIRQLESLAESSSSGANLVVMQLRGDGSDELQDFEVSSLPFASVRELALKDLQICESSVEQLRYLFPNVERLLVEGCEFRVDGSDFLCECFPKVREVKMIGCHSISAKLFSELKKLHSFDAAHPDSVIIQW